MTAENTLKVKELSLTNTILHSHFKGGYLRKLPYEEMLENAVISFVKHQDELQTKLVSAAEKNKNDFINGVASTLAYILDNGKAIPEKELQRIGSIVLEKHGIKDKS